MLSLLFLAVVLTTQTPATPSPAPTATASSNAVVSRALERLQLYGTPPYVAYLIEENGITHRIAFRGTDEMMNDSAYAPDQDRVPPARVYRAFVGPLAYSVHEAIATPAPSDTQPVSPTDLASTLKTIAVVSSRGHLYDVGIGDIERMDGRETYHITLKPRKDAEKNVLRDLWIDTATYDVVRAGYVYPHPPDVVGVGTQADLVVDFVTLGRYRIASHWGAFYHAFGLTKPLMRELKVVKMTFPDKLPDWLFDQTLYDGHRRAGEPDPLTHVFDSDGSG